MIDKMSMKWMLTIVDRKKGKLAAKILNECNVNVMFEVRGRGTANSEVMDYLGLDEPEKDIIIGIVPGILCNPVFCALEASMYFSQPGKGIAFTLPITGVNMSTSQRVYERSTQMEINQKDGNVPLACQFALAVAAVNADYTDVVMNAAKSAGCTGGTVLKAREIYFENVQKLFGVEITPEKEIVLMLVKKDMKQGIMKAVSNAILCETGEPGIVISLPVDQVFGLKNN